MGYLLAFGTGLIVGIIFKLMNLPIPAPSELKGILGIIGIYLGYILVKQFIK